MDTGTIKADRPTANNMIWNLTKDNIAVRLAKIDHYIWAPTLAAADVLRTIFEYARQVMVKSSRILKNSYTGIIGILGS